MYERVLKIRETVYGADHPDVATAFNNLGVLLQKRGDLRGAKLNLTRALSISEAKLGSDHPRTVTHLVNLASVFEEGGDLAGARRLFQRALPILKRVGDKRAMQAVLQRLESISEVEQFK
jgi:Tfp pilus assembly protein PilF